VGGVKLPTLIVPRTTYVEAASGEIGGEQDGVNRGRGPESSLRRKGQGEEGGRAEVPLGGGKTY